MSMADHGRYRQITVELIDDMIVCANNRLHVVMECDCVAQILEEKSTQFISPGTGRRLAPSPTNSACRTMRYHPHNNTRHFRTLTIWRPPLIGMQTIHPAHYPIRTPYQILEIHQICSLCTHKNVEHFRRILYLFMSFPTVFATY